jgi:hypothetical protein
VQAEAAATVISSAEAETATSVLIFIEVSLFTVINKRANNLCVANLCRAFMYLK